MASRKTQEGPSCIAVKVFAVTGSATKKPRRILGPSVQNQVQATQVSNNPETRKLRSIVSPPVAAHAHPHASCREGQENSEDDLAPVGHVGCGSAASGIVPHSGQRSGVAR